MRLFAQLLIVVSLVAASLSASVAYHVSLELPDEALLGLTLEDGADIVWSDPDSIRAEDRVLTAERLEELRTARLGDVEDKTSAMVRVREFSFRRWTGKWIFLVSILGLGAGSLILRAKSRTEHGRQTEQRRATSPAERLGQFHTAIEELVKEIEQEVTGEAGSGTQGSGASACRLATRRIAEIQQNEVTEFLNSQPQLIAQVGLGPAAEVLDEFAANERQLNRAWSAAADEHQEEMLERLHMIKRPESPPHS